MLTHAKAGLTLGRGTLSPSGDQLRIVRVPGLRHTMGIYVLDNVLCRCTPNVNGGPFESSPSLPKAE